MLRILASVRDLNIVVVGANDGKANDPIYGFTMKKKRETKILLIEPNQQLLPYLEDNYSEHPSHKIANCAIGEEGQLVLYSLKREFWKDFNPKYAKEWPSYRAATGITSALKSEVEDALVRQNIDPGIAIVGIQVTAKRLGRVLEELNWPTPIDILQIDAEGYDDMVLRNSNLTSTKPTLIYFETHKMPDEKVKSLKHYLFRRKYRVYVVGGNSFAIKSAASPLSFLLTIVMSLYVGLHFLYSAVSKPFTFLKDILSRHGEK